MSLTSSPDGCGANADQACGHQCLNQRLAGQARPFAADAVMHRDRGSRSRICTRLQSASNHHCSGVAWLADWHRPMPSLDCDSSGHQRNNSTPRGRCRQRQSSVGAALRSRKEYKLMNAQAIAELPGLGPKSEAMLAAAGINTVAQLKLLGSVRAYAMVKATGTNASLNLLWAMEGALTGLPWQVVAREHRLSLLLALKAHNSDA